jgi:hypothetical protein
MTPDPVPFDVKVYKTSRAFNVPKRVRTELGIRGGDSIHLTIRNLAGEVLFSDRKTLKSGSEIYGTDVASALVPGSKIFVEASEPRFLETDAEADAFAAQERVAGFQPSPEIRRLVELHAMRCAQDKLSEMGFGVFHDTSAHECYDLTCERKGELYYVEVKGTQGAGTSVILTANEAEHAMKYPQRSIAVIVSQIEIVDENGKAQAKGGRSRVFLPWTLELASLKPLQYQWNVSKSHQESTEPDVQIEQD